MCIHAWPCEATICSAANFCTLETQERENPTLQQELEAAISITQSKNVVSGSTITAGGNVHIGDKHVTQNAEKIYNIDKIDNANFS